MEPTNAATYLFDFDGTLVDSMPTYVAIMLRILEEYGGTAGPGLVEVITPLGYRGAAEYYRTLGVDAPVEELVARMNALALDAYAHRIPAKPGVAGALAALRQRGAGMNVLTASPHAVLDPCLKRLGLWELFDNVWSCEDFGTTKSDPAIYRMAAQRLGRPVEQVIFLDDNLNAVRTAKQAGMQSWGVYDPSSHAQTDAIKAAADWYLVSLRELAAP